MATAYDVRRAGSRFTTRTDAISSRHSFSFGSHYDPVNTHFGLLLACNDETLRPGSGFPEHPHRDLEIVTWVLEGVLVHEDSAGCRSLVYPGLVQRLSAGAGILHAEANDAWHVFGGLEHQTPVRFIQMWIMPDTPGADPGYEQRDISAELERGGLVTLASGMPRHRGETATRIGQRDAALHVARMETGETLSLPTAPYAHLYVASGALDVEEAGFLGGCDAVRVTDAAGQKVVACEPSEVLIWEMHSDVHSALVG